VRVPATSGNPTARRRELGTMLRALRTARGLTVERVAELLLISPSKISRVETGQRGATARDVRDFARLYELSSDEQQVLTDLAAEGKQRAWWQPFNISYSTYAGLESDAESIKDFNLETVPGLLQTESYAKALIQALVPQWSDKEIGLQVQARVQRQQRVIRSDDGARSFVAVIDEAVLRRTVGGPDVMREQLAALRDASRLSNVTLQVVPFEAGPLPVGTNKFIILGFGRPSMPDVVYLETFTGELVLDTAAEVAQYAEAFARLREMSLSPDDTRDFIASLVPA
jgi:transcriptional regulator with XRE-family HTH domain